MPRPVIVEYAKGANGQGARYQVDSAAIAKKRHPDAKIVEFADTGEIYTEDAPRTEAQARKVAEQPAEKAAPAPTSEMLREAEPETEVKP